MPQETLEDSRTLLEALGDVNNVLIRIAQLLRENPRLTSVVRGCDIRKYETSTIFESFVEAETQPKTAFCWWFEVRPVESGWIVERSLRRTTREGQDVIKEFLTHTFRDIGHFALQAKDLAEEFLPSVEQGIFPDAIAGNEATTTRPQA